MELRFKWMLLFYITIVFADCFSKTFSIRVLLHTATLNEHFKFESIHGFSLWDSAKPTVKMHNDAKICAFLYKKAGFFCNKKRVKPEVLCIASHDHHIVFNGKTYQGMFHLINTGKNILIINVLDIEDYVFSVLKTESWPGWPLEVNKVFAIACRTYALKMALQARKAKRSYDVKNSNVHQTYTGVHSCKIIKKRLNKQRAYF